jgi:hypothetical protein
MAAEGSLYLPVNALQDLAIAAAYGGIIIKIQFLIDDLVKA